MKKKNWTEYNGELVKRGSLTFWISEDIWNTWYAIKNPKKRGLLSSFLILQ